MPSKRVILSQKSGDLDVLDFGLVGAPKFLHFFLSVLANQIVSLFEEEIVLAEEIEFLSLEYSGKLRISDQKVSQFDGAQHFDPGFEIRFGVGSKHAFFAIRF